MKATLTEKIIRDHLVAGSLESGGEIGLRIDQTLTQDATGTMANLQFEVLDIPKVRTKLSVSYIDHNTLQTGFENADDHRFLQSMAAKYGMYFSRPGNGVCHQIHLERFGVPGQTLLGSDSHTPTAGGLGMLAIGAGGLDVAVAMAGGPFYLNTPKVLGVRLVGSLKPWVSAKDVILEILRELTVKGGVGKVVEYFGPGVETLTVPERATITNMGAELGATTSVFPSDTLTKEFLDSQGRASVWKELKADKNAEYSDVIEIDLSQIEPLIAKPHSPDNVVPVSELSGTKVDQVVVGSCTNSSYRDLATVARILENRGTSDNVSFYIAPGSREVLLQITKEGLLEYLVKAGARILEPACGPCIGMGSAPPSGGISLRTINRNFEGRSGTADAKVYLCSPETAVASAISGEITDPRSLGDYPRIELPKRFYINDSLIIPPPENPGQVEIIRGPNIKPLPINKELADSLEGKVLIKVGDNITTDHIMPAGSKILPLRSNIPAISEHTFELFDPEFVKRCKEAGGGFIVGGENYGQGSSREHAALAPMYLGIKAVLAKSFARIHRNNLINFGILPLVFSDLSDYDLVEQGDGLVIPSVRESLSGGKDELIVKNTKNGKEIIVSHGLSERHVRIVLAGGLLNFIRENGV